jgi:GNAT superfamily N-acetyltransferase
MTIRELDRTKDRRGVEAIDTTFETLSVFDVVTTERRIELVERSLAQPLVKRYSIAEVFASWARWDRGWVADDGGVRGVATAAYEPWHQRMILWHLYIVPEWRRRGLSRALLERVEAHGREVGANHVWLETSTVNVPGVAAYRQLGYTLCGADTLFYGPYMPGESAIYLAKPL